jgi:hypothetical protein
MAANVAATGRSNTDRNLFDFYQTTARGAVYEIASSSVKALGSI